MSKFSKIAATVRSPKFSSGAICAVTVVLILVANMILYALGTAFGWYIYSPQKNDYSLKSKSVDEQLKAAEQDYLEGRLGSKVKIIFCMDKSDLTNHKTGGAVLKTAQELAENYKDLIDLRFINIITRMEEKSDGTHELVDLDKYKKPIADGPENRILKTSVIFECEDRIEVLNDTQSSDGYSTFYTLTSDMSVTSYNGEEILSSIVLRMMKDDAPTAYFTIGHGENSSTSLTSMFGCAGYTFETINLKEKGVPGEKEGSVLIISNPLTDFEKSTGVSGVVAEIDRLEAYIRAGGHVYIALDPYVASNKLSNLKELLKKYGIEISITAKEGSESILLPNIVRDTENSITTDGYTVIAGFSQNENAEKIEEHVTANGTGKVLLREAAALNCTGNAYPILITSPSSVCEVGGAVTDRAGSYCVAAASYIDVEGKDPGTIFVSSSAYLTSDDVIVAEGYSNKDFIYAVADEIFYADTPPYGCGGILLNTNMLEGLTMGAAKIYTVIACLIPAAIAITGAVIIIRRRNR